MMRRIVFGSLAITVLFLCSLIAADEQSNIETPEQVTERAMQATSEGNYEQVIALMHDETLAQFRSLLLAAAESAEASGRAADVLRFFEGVKDIEDLRKLNAAETFTAFMRGLIDRNESLAAFMRDANFQALGHVPEGKDTAHVVGRYTFEWEGEKFTMMEVASMKRTPQGWRMLPKGDVEAMAKQLKRRFSEKSAKRDENTGEK